MAAPISTWRLPYSHSQDGGAHLNMAAAVQPLPRWRRPSQHGSPRRATPKMAAPPFPPFAEAPPTVAPSPQSGGGARGLEPGPNPDAVAPPMPKRRRPPQPLYLVCPLLCRNGGVCAHPDTCLCPPNLPGSSVTSRPTAPGEGQPKILTGHPKISGGPQGPGGPQALTQSVYTLPLANHREEEDDVDECEGGGRCLHGLCTNTRGSFACLCPPGFLLDASRSSCISHQVLSEARGPCYRVLREGGGCALPTLRNITRQICCCSRVGKAWGGDCHRCPPFGSAWCPLSPQTMESQVEEWYKEVGELQVQVAALPAQAMGRQAVGEWQSAVGTRIVRLIEPLKERRRILLASKEVHQVSHELEDEVLWVQDRLPLATLKDHGTNLQTVQQFIKKNQNLRREIQVHRPHVDEVLERAGAVASIKSPEAEGVRRLLERLGTMWTELQEQAERRQQTLDATYQLEQYYFDVAEVESWLGEQELLLMNEEKGKDEQSTLQLLKKHLLTEQTVENYEETIAQLSRQCRALLELGHPQSEQVSRRQSQVDRLYVSLKDLVEERKTKLEQQYWLYQLNREVDELEHWIAEKEVVAGSPELGQDFEHVTLLQEKFLEFASETGSVGQERIAAVNQMVDELIDYGHADAATIAEWKDGVNEAWADLLELMETRAQMLAASHELHKFFNDCKEVLGQIEEKRQRLPELAAREGRTSAGALQRALGAFEHDVEVLVTQVRQLQEGAAQLRTLYAGDNAEAIAGREQEVLRAWKELLGACEECRLHVASIADKIRFVGTVRDLLAWMDGVLCQIGAGEKPRDVSSVELLMNDHQGLKSEMDARGKNIAACLELGKTLILSKSPAADEIKAHVDKLLAKKKEMVEKWEKHWEWLQQMLEVHQFAQEAVVADAWLTAQEPLLKSQELGSSVDEVEQLIRRHEAFRKAAAAWEERFSSLRRLTTIEKLKAEQTKQPPTPLLSRKFLGDPTGGSVPPERRLEPRVAYVRHELHPERLQPKLDRVQGPPTEGVPGGGHHPLPPPGDPQVPPKPDEVGDTRLGLLERRRERRERRLERQESSEPEPPRQDGKGKATLADIVEQLQEKEAGGPSPASPRDRDSPARLPTGPEALPERTPRPDRPRARDRPKPRRRPRPKDPSQGPGETRRSRSAPAQGSAPPPPPPPTHTVTHEGFLFRKHELDGPNKKASNRSWVNLYCVLSKGDLGFYKDAKGHAAGSTHGGEPLLNLHNSTSEVASDYKKKKNVFKLKTSDGSEFLLQAKDEEDMRGWLRALTTCAQEHGEVARWQQGLLTTSSTDEGLPRREGERRPSASARRK
ncbi:LOW QUALITY PROTEIN: spectrin beta chain, non-erythrocytic 4-like [Aegotheles albertisi]